MECMQHLYHVSNVKHVSSTSCFKCTFKVIESLGHLMTLSTSTLQMINAYIFKYDDYWEPYQHHSWHSLHHIYFHFIMPPKTIFTVPLGNVKEVVTETRRTKHGVRTSTKEVPFYSSNQGKSGRSSEPKHHPHAHKAHAESSNIIYEDAEESHPLPSIDGQDDGFEGLDMEEDIVLRDVRPMLWLHIAECLIFARHQWINGCRSEADISISYWRWRVLQNLQCVQCAEREWRSSAAIALEVTTFALPAAFKHTSGFHCIGSSTGLVHTFHQPRSIHLDLNYALVMLVIHVHWL